MEILILDDLEMSEILNSYFGSLFTKENLRDNLQEDGPKDNAGNYRPVGLTTQACKLLQSILRDNIIRHL